MDNIALNHKVNQRKIIEQCSSCSLSQIKTAKRKWMRIRMRHIRGKMIFGRRISKRKCKSSQSKK